MQRIICVFMIMMFSFACINSAFAESETTEISNTVNDEQNSSTEEPDEETPSGNDSVPETEDSTGDIGSENKGEEKEEESSKDGDKENQTDYDTEYEYQFTELSDAYDKVNIQDYTPDDTERETIFDTDNILRRDGVSGEAYVVFEIPYVNEFYAISCHRPADVAEFSFEYSKDGIEWISAVVDIERTVADDKWTILEYSANDIEGVRFVKVIWGEEEESVHWWNPYFAGLYANAGESIPTEIVIDTESEAVIPMYDTAEIELRARIIDQIGAETPGEIVWSVVECGDERVKISEENTIELYSDMNDETEIVICAECIELSLTAEHKITLYAPVPGDVNGDRVITEKDISVITENYGKASDKDNRLCDVDKNGFIDIVDLAYAAMYMELESEN